MCDRLNCGQSEDDVEYSFSHVFVGALDHDAVTTILNQKHSWKVHPGTNYTFDVTKQKVYFKTRLIQNA